jgi:chromosome segregation ATPase
MATMRTIYSVPEQPSEQKSMTSRELAADKTLFALEPTNNMTVKDLNDIKEFAYKKKEEVSAKISVVEEYHRLAKADTERPSAAFEILELKTLVNNLKDDLQDQRKESAKQISKLHEEISELHEEISEHDGQISHLRSNLSNAVRIVAIACAAPLDSAASKQKMEETGLQTWMEDNLRYHNCSVCNIASEGIRFKYCGNCKDLSNRYCGVECFKRAWPAHKVVCKK